MARSSKVYEPSKASSTSETATAAKPPPSDSLTAASAAENTSARPLRSASNFQRWLSVIVPCHRVLGSTGQLTGYAGGLERKRALLLLEGHHDLFQ